jgi:hypothetical protein
MKLADCFFPCSAFLRCNCIVKLLLDNNLSILISNLLKNLLKTFGIRKVSNKKKNSYKKFGERRFILWLPFDLNLLDILDKTTKGKVKEDLQPLFITVDPVRDDPKAITEYLKGNNIIIILS